MDVQRWVERTFAKWGWGQVIAGLVVGGLLAYIAGLPLSQYSDERFEVLDRGGNVPGVVSHLYDRRDARGVIPANNEPKDDGVFDLAVLADSSFLIIDPPPEYAHKQQKRFTLTKMIAAHIATIGGKKLRIHEYYHDGTRTADTRRVLLQAISDPKIDAVTLVLNPFLFFNDYVAFAGTTQRSKLLYQSGIELSDLKLLALSVRPSDYMMDALSAMWPVYDRRFPLSEIAARAQRSVLPAGLPFPMREAGPRGPAYMIYDFMKWLYPPEAVDLVSRSRKLIFYAAAIQSNNLGNNSIGDAVLRANLRSLKAWGKPAMLYVPPLDPTFAKDPNWPMMVQIIRQFSIIRAQFRGTPNIKLVVDQVMKAYPPVLYHDPYHMKSGEGFVHQFADMLEKQFGLPIERRDVSKMFGPGS